LPKLRLKFGSIRGALHFKSLCNKAYLITREDDSIDSIIIRVLQKIGQESEFNKRYMQDIIENHLMTKT
ncbi:hypothetical protein ACEJ80_19180, partial [Acinetobacter baumannii]